MLRDRRAVDGVPVRLRFGEMTTTDKRFEHRSASGKLEQPLPPTTRGMWLPLVAVIVVLGVLAVAPIVVGVRVRRLRAAISDVIDPARLRATDLSAALSEEMLAIGTQVGPAGAPQDPLYQTSLSDEHGDALALDSLLRYSDADAVERFAQYREASSRWHDDVDAMSRSTSSLAEGAAARNDGVAALAAVRRLSNVLEQFRVSAREQVRGAERIDVLLPVAIVPLALLACVLVVRAGRRTVGIAVRAERDRRALAVAMDQKSAFMRGISHDLQNPLGAAVGHVELILDGLVKPEDQRDSLLRVRRLITTSAETVASLVSLARSETGIIELDPTAIDLCALARAAVDDHSLVARRKQQRIAFTGVSECHAIGDAARTRHIVDNVLSNSSKYTPAGGAIRVVVAQRRRNDRVWSTVTVQDSGPGIPPEWRERVFEEFERVPGSRDLAPGNGIGLAVSRRVARIMGGDLTLETSPDVPDDGQPLGGAAFTLWLASADVNDSA